MLDTIPDVSPSEITSNRQDLELLLQPWAAHYAGARERAEMVASVLGWLNYSYNGFSQWPNL